MAGYDTVSVLTTSLTSAARNTYGTPAFWLRYFTPSPYTTINSSQSNANNESRAAWSSGGHYMGVVTSPGHPSASQAQGHADAQATANACYNYWLDVIPVLLPSNNTLYVWTDLEPGQNLGLGYWTGWALYIDGYQWPGTSELPLYPCLYCNPCDVGHNCSTIRQSSAPYCFAIWSFEPQRCGNTVANPPSWAATTCSACAGYSGTPTQLWQFRIKTQSCPASVNVDQNLGGGINYANYCFNISSNP